MPFLVHDDGRYDEDLSAFLRHLPASGAASASTWKAYAHDVAAWCAFLTEVRGQPDWRQAREQDLAVYHTLRRLTAGPLQLSPAAWNRALAALNRLYEWAVETGRVTTSPVRKTAHVAMAGGTPVSVQGAALAAPVVEQTVRALSPQEFCFFRDVGLRGQLPDGRPDPAFRGHEGERNALMADLLARTGLRIAEGSALILWDILELVLDDLPASREITFMLPSAIAKRGKPRRVHLPVTLLQQLRDYLGVERQARLEVGTGETGFQAIQDPILVRRGRAGYYVPVGGEPLPLDRCPRDRRLRLVASDASGRPVEPLWLWLAEDGAPVGGEDAWNKVFRRASERCAAHGRPMDVTPHHLRHTFAVNFLSHLIRATVLRAQVPVRDVLDDPGSQTYRTVIGDPLRILQRRLGHASIQTTHRYLTYVADAQDIESDALAGWDAAVFGPAAAGEAARGA
jgi:site-specific recombinase XerD